MIAEFASVKVESIPAGQKSELKTLIENASSLILKESIRNTKEPDGINTLDICGATATVLMSLMFNSVLALADFLEQEGGGNKVNLLLNQEEVLRVACNDTLDRIKLYAEGTK
jgi:hypothetical protein